jgi:parallel beta-helix repeat protein
LNPVRGTSKHSAIAGPAPIALVLLTAAVLSGCAAGTTGEPLGVTGTEAQVGGTVISDVGGEVEYWVEYGRTTTYGSGTEHQTATVDRGVQRTVVVNIANLERSTTYHYRLCARDSQQTGGPACGGDRQFTTVNVDCGETITADLRLSGDLGCRAVSGEDGLIVGADGIDINLAGHGVEGVNFAIRNDGGFDDVTVRNGSLYAIAVALRLDGASRNRIRDVRAGRLSSPFVEPSTGTGISIAGGEDNVVRASRVEAERIGLLATDTSRLLVEGSTGRAAMGSRGPATAIEVRGDLARILRNELGAGIAVTGAGNRVAGNRVVGQAFGIQVGGEGNVIAENEVRDTAAFSVVPESGDGIVVSPGSTGTLLRANLAISNDEDGIDVRSADTRLRDNTANDNGDFGIDAVQGVIDLGGNTASGNGNPLSQCRNVSCG